MKITSTLLRSRGACADQLAEFQRRFPDGVTVTENLCVSVAGIFDWDWAAAHLLPAPALADYKRITAPALAEYERIRATAWVDYERITAPAFGRVASEMTA